MSLVWKKHLKQAAGCVMAAILSLSACLSNAPITAYADNYGKGGTVREMTSQQIVEDMGLGYNIGNTFDSIGSFITTHDPTEYQKAWGNDPVTKLFIHKVREGGFKTVRLPVSWSHWIDENDRVDPAYMAEVQKVVDWCMEEGMYVILNIHHDGGESDTSWIRKASQDYGRITKKYQTVWQQIADNFAGYGDHLIFESMNEVFFPDVSMSRQYEILNGMNQIFVDTVRASGGNNPKRHLLIAGYNTDIKNTCDKRYKVPDDPAGRCIVSIHYYSPSPFAVAPHDVDWCTPVTTWGTEEDLATVRSDLDKLAERFLTKGVPVIIGEYGVLTTDNKELSSIHAYVQKIPEIIMEYGMCPVLWDTSNAGDMKFIERITGEFYDPVIKANYQALAQKQAMGQIQRVQFDFPTYKEVDVPISPDGWVSLDAFEPDRILGIKFQVTCANDWDSYGGGGIYIDSWDNTINWQFNSVFDDIIHMFTPEEKARIQDQLGVAIWWTDESKGGSHRNALSIADGKVTLLYEEQTAVTPSGMIRTASSGGSGGGGGGGGGGGRGGSAPNYSTDPVGSEQGLGGKYRYIIKVDGNKATNDENVQQLDLRQLQPDYQIGDTVKITLTCVSNGGTSYAIGTMEGGDFKLSETANNEKTYSWTCTPDYGNASVSVWYLGGDYMAFNADVEVVKKAPRFDPFTITYEQAKDGYDLTPQIKAAMERYGLKAGDRMKITVSTEQVNGEYAGDILFTSENGIDVSTSLKESTVLYAPKLGSGISIKLDNLQYGAGPASNPIKITNIKVEKMDTKKEPDVLAQFETQGSVEEIPMSWVTTEVTDADYGLKLYVDCTADFKDVQWRLTINSQEIGHNLNTDKWELKNDGGESFIWYPMGADDTLSRLAFNGWYWPGTLKIKKVVHVTAKPPADLEPITITPQQAVSGFSLLEAIKKVRDESGIASGKRVLVTLSVDKGENNDGDGVVHFTNADGFEVSADLADTILLCAPSKGAITFKNGDNSSITSMIKITDIQVEEINKEADVLTQVKGGNKITIPSKKIVTEQGSATGFKIYFDDVDNVKNAAYAMPKLDWDWVEFTNTAKATIYSDHVWIPKSSVSDIVIGLYGWVGGDAVLKVKKVAWVTDSGDSLPISINASGTTLPLNFAEYETGDEAGVKVYFNPGYDGVQMSVNGGDRVDKSKDGAAGQDDEGEYLWYACNDVQSIVVYNYSGSDVKVKEIRIIEADGIMPLNEEEELLDAPALEDPDIEEDEALGVNGAIINGINAAESMKEDPSISADNSPEKKKPLTPIEDPADDPDDGKAPADDVEDKKDPTDDVEDKKDPADDGKDEKDPSKDESQNDKKDPADDSEGKADAPDDEEGKKDPSKDQEEKDPNAAMDTSGESKSEETPKADIPVKAVKDQEDVADAPAAAPAQQSADTK